MSYEPQAADIIQYRKWTFWRGRRALLNHFAIVFLHGQFYAYETWPPMVRRMTFADHESRWIFRTSERTIYRNRSLDSIAILAIREEVMRQWTEEVPYSWWYNFIAADPNVTNCIELLCDAIVKAYGPVWDRDHGRVTPRLFVEGIKTCGWRELEWMTNWPNFWLRGEPTTE